MSQNSSTLGQQLDAALVQQAMDLITPARRIALLAHEHPDGDCLGSALGLAHILRALGKSCVPACADPPPPFLTFLPASETVATDLGAEDFDLVIALDAGELYRFGSLYARHQNFLSQARILNIDHHLGGNGCGQVNIIDTGAAATAEILVLFQQQAKLPLPKEAALCLLTGLITDTGSFQFTNTTPRTLEVAAELLRHEAAPETVAQPLYRSHSLAEMRLQGAIFEQATTSCEGQLIWSWATSETLARTGNTVDQDGNGSGLLRDIAGVKIAAFFKNYADAPDITRLSMRSAEPYNAAELCKRLSNGEGGGHARAAGATFHLPLQETMALVIPALEKELGQD
jgi:bifunctional oligoribonuclease and PAP phosphatase NrnA